MTRWKAAGTHLLLSVAIVGGIAVTAFLLWYPHDLYKVAGLDRILLLMWGIDLTAGPLLTLILYRPGKWGLKFDLYAVALAQLAFLVYGLHTLWDGRPIFLVGTPETFTVVFASEVSDDDLAMATSPEWRRRSWTGPQLVGTRMPDDPEQRREILDEFMAGGAGIERSPKYYQPYENIAPLIIAKKTAYASKVAQRGENRGGLIIDHPIVSRRGEGTIAVSAKNGAPLLVLSGSPSE